MDKHKTAEWQTEIENGYEFGKKKKNLREKVRSNSLSPPNSAIFCSESFDCSESRGNCHIGAVCERKTGRNRARRSLTIVLTIVRNQRVTGRV